MKSKLFGSYLRDTRVCMNVNQDSIAERAGISRRTVVDIEKGVRLPILSNFEDIVTAYNLSGDRLVERYYITDYVYDWIGSSNALCVLHAIRILLRLNVQDFNGLIHGSIEQFKKLSNVRDIWVYRVNNMFGLELSKKWEEQELDEDEIMRIARKAVAFYNKRK